MHFTTFLLLLLIQAVVASDQTVGVRGQLMCGNQPLAGVEVKLWELNIWPNPDDALATVNTDSQGRFQLSGTKSEIMSINPVLKIYHNCNNKWALCKRKMVYNIPSSYITRGRTVGQWYDMGTMNMEAKQRNEDTKCFGKR